MSQSSNSYRFRAGRLPVMTQPLRSDLFTNVHKGIRRALFSACVDLGRSDGDFEREHAARARLDEALHFVAHHGDNEDQLLLPLLRERAPEAFSRMTAAHAVLDQARTALLVQPTMSALYLATCAFTAQYLAHMDEEERVLEPLIREALANDELSEFGRRSVARTGPSDQRMMLQWMLPAMTSSDVAAFLARLPPALAAEVEPLSRTAV